MEQDPEYSPLEDVTKALPHAIGPEKSVLSSILQQPDTFIRLALNEGVEAEDFYLPQHRTLFGVILKLHEDEKPIELVSFVQHLLDLGLLDRVGGPAAVMELHNYAVSSSHFTTHVQMVKDKSILREIIQKANSQICAAYDAPDEVMDLVERVGNDAIQIKEKTDTRLSSFKKYKEQIVTPESMMDEVVSYLNGDRILGGDPFFLKDFDFASRKHECTVWLGTSFHGKSQCVQNQVAFLAAMKRPSMIASFEQPPAITLGQILKTMTAYPDIAKSEYFPKAWAYINKMVSMYKGQRRIRPKKVIETFRQAYLNDGIDTFVLDNLMTLAVDRGDNSALAEAVDLIRVFVLEFPIHFHLVVHPRKPTGNEPPNKVPTQSDIRGPAEIGDMPQNVIVVSRDIAKHKKMEEMKAEGRSDFEIHQFYSSTPCGKIAMEKQRLTGTIPTRNTWFHAKTNQFLTEPGVAKPMFGDTPPWET